MPKKKSEPLSVISDTKVDRNTVQKTPAELIHAYNQIEDHLSAEGKKFQEWSKPYKEKQEAIRNQLLAMLNALNDGKPEGKRASFSTEHGTAFLSTTVTPKWSDKEQGLDFVLDNWDKYGAMLQIGAPQVDAVREYQDANEGRLPPFVEVNSFTRCNIRRS